MGSADKGKDIIYGLGQIARMLQTQVLRVRQANEPYIGLIQENLIESSV